MPQKKHKRKDRREAAPRSMFCFRKAEGLAKRRSIVRSDTALSQLSFSSQACLRERRVDHVMVKFYVSERFACNVLGQHLSARPSR